MSSLVQPFIGVADLVRDYGLTTFIETGCENGHSLGVAYDLGLRCISCDINADHVAECRLKFPNAEISHAESLAGLAYACSRIGYDEPALVWSDAHWGPPPYDTYPVRAELEYLAANLKPLATSVILVDDWSAVMHSSLEHKDWTEFQGSQFVDFTTADIVAMFPYHQATVIAQNTGVLMLVPRARAT